MPPRKRTPSAKKQQSASAKKQQKEQEDEAETQRLADLHDNNHKKDEGEKNNEDSSSSSSTATPASPAQSTRNNKSKKNDAAAAAAKAGSASSSDDDNADAQADNNDNDDGILPPEPDTEIYRFRRTVAAAILRRVVTKRRAASAAATTTTQQPPSTPAPKTTTSRAKSAGGKKAYDNNVTGSSDNAAIRIPKIELATLQTAAQKPVLGAPASLTGSSTSTAAPPASASLCALGFHIVGSAPLLSRTDDSFPVEARLNLFALSPAENNNGGINRRRGRNNNNESNNAIQNDSEAPVPEEWQHEIVKFQDCAHSCCRTCAVNQLTLDFAARGAHGATGDRTDVLALPCSFCHGNSSLKLRIPAMPRSSQHTNLVDDDQDDNNDATFFESLPGGSARGYIAGLFAEQFPVAGGDNNSGAAHHHNSRAAALTAARSWTMFTAVAERIVEERNGSNTSNSSTSTHVTQQQQQQQQDAAASAIAVPDKVECGICEEQVKGDHCKFCLDCGFAICDHGNKSCMATVHSKGKFRSHRTASLKEGLQQQQNQQQQQQNLPSGRNSLAAMSDGGFSFDDPSSSNQNTNNSSNSAVKRFCSDHPQYPLDIFDVTCNRIICLMCHFAGDTHRGHEVKPLQEVQQEARQSIFASADALRTNTVGVASDFAATLQNRVNSVDNCAATVLTATDAVFTRLHETLDQRKAQLAAKVQQWQQAAQTAAQNDNAIVAALLQGVVDVLRACESVTAADTGLASASQQQQQQQQNLQDNDQQPRDAGSVTADALSLRDAVEFRVRNMLDNILVKACKEHHVASDGSQQKNVELLLREAALAAVRREARTNPNAQPVAAASAGLTPQFGVVVDELTSALEDFVDVNADQSMVLPHWLSFIELLVGAATRKADQQQKQERASSSRAGASAVRSNNNVNSNNINNNNLSPSTASRLRFGQSHPAAEFNNAAATTATTPGSAGGGGGSAATRRPIAQQQQQNNISPQNRLTDLGDWHHAPPAAPAVNNKGPPPPPQSTAGVATGTHLNTQQQQTRDAVLGSSLFGAPEPRPQQQQQGGGAGSANNSGSLRPLLQQGGSGAGAGGATSADGGATSGSNPRPRPNPFNLHLR